MRVSLLSLCALCAPLWGSGGRFPSRTADLGLTTSGAASGAQRGPSDLLTTGEAKRPTAAPEGGETRANTMRAVRYPHLASGAPLLAGDGWRLPVEIDGSDTSGTTEASPSLCADGNGNLLVVTEDITTPATAFLNIYRSTDGGATWNYVYSLINGNNGDLRNPNAACDVGGNYLYVAVDSYWYSGLFGGQTGVECARVRLSDDALASAWVMVNLLEVAGPPAVAVEHGYGTANRVFVAYESFYMSNYYANMSHSVDSGATWIDDGYSGGNANYRGQMRAFARDNFACAVFKENPTAPSFDGCTTFHILFSADRGASWLDFTITGFPNGIYQSSATGAYDTDELLYAAQIQTTVTNNDVIMLYSLNDPPSTWGWYWFDQSAYDSRMPALAADGAWQDVATTRRLHIAYFDDRTGLTTGNAHYLHVPKALWSSRAGWGLQYGPPMLDSLAIAAEDAYGVITGSWGQLSMTTLSSSWSDEPALAWCHPVTSTDDDVFFTRWIEPSVSSDEGASPTGRVAASLAGGVLTLRLPAALVGSRVALYDAAGSVVTKAVSAGRTVRLDLSATPAGAYFWSVGAERGAFVKAE